VNFDIAYKVMLPALQFFAAVTHSYGWSIILLTLAVRIIVWPLVAKSTTSMMRMSKLQPQLKAMQARYKSDPEVFQKKMMEFYSKNKINPMSGCLPTLIQLPVLFALFAAFSGPPFGDKLIDVKINVVEKTQDLKQSETSSGNSAYLSTDNKAAKIVVFPGESTVAKGDSLNFGTRAVEGELAKDFTATWKVVGPDNKNAQGPESDPMNAAISADGHATFQKPGEYHVICRIPGIAKNEHFGYLQGLGKVANGLELFKPSNWDTLSLIVLFGATMFLSQKFTVTTPKPAPGEELDEQQLIQQQTAKTMPIVATAMFFFIPLPTGVYLYLVVSNVIQTLQTWLIMKMPEPAFVDVSDGDSQSTSNGQSSDKPNGKKSGNENGTGNGGTSSSSKKKAKKNNEKSGK
jgi:YidC/Oxa1 family membrane protein insertase